MSDDTIIQVKNLVKWFQVRKGLFSTLLGKKPLYVHAVDGISFSMKRGEILVMAGESGCGKTTTGKLLLNLVPPTSGEVIFEGQNIYDLNKRDLKLLRRRMQIIFQDPYESLNPRLSIYDTVAEPVRIHGIAKSYEHEYDMVVSALQEANLTPPEEFLHRYPHELSGGQRQRVAIARALVLRPEFIVADEPVSMLDVSIRAGILNLLLELRDKHKITYFFITHDLAVASYIGDRIAIMYLGKLMELAPTRELVSNPLHPYAMMLLAAVPTPDPLRKHRRVALKGEPPSPINPPSGCRFHPRCPYAKPICKEKEPELREYKPGHFVACHFAGEITSPKE